MSTLYERREYVGDDGVSRIYMMVDYRIRDLAH